MSKLYLYLITCIVFLACSSRVRENVYGDNIAKDSIHNNDTSLRQCIPEKDTLVSKGSFISYVIIDSFYTLKIQIDGQDTLLSYQFNCSTPRGLVPSVHSFYNNTICLIRGSGQHYREFLICYVDNNRINIKYYETALAVDLKRNIVAYQSVDSFQIVYVEDIKTKARRKFVLPSKISSTIVSQAILKKDKLIIGFIDDKKVYFSF